MTPGTPIGLRIDQTLTQDATGTLVMLELEAMGLDRVKTEVSVQYVDHNIIQADYKNPDDHLFLRSACQRFWGMVFGAWKRGEPSVPSRELRQAGQDAPRLRQPHAGGRRDRHAGHRRRRAGSGAGNGGRAVLHAHAADLGREAHRPAAGLGERQGRDPRDAAPPQRGGRTGPDHRVLRAGARRAECDGSARDRQHGRRAGRDNHRLPFRPGGVPFPACVAARRGLGGAGRGSRGLRRARRDRSQASSR